MQNLQLKDDFLYYQHMPTWILQPSCSKVESVHKYSNKEEKAAQWESQLAWRASGNRGESCWGGFEALEAMRGVNSVNLEVGERGNWEASSSASTCFSVLLQFIIYNKHNSSFPQNSLNDWMARYAALKLLSPETSDASTSPIKML